MHLAPKETKVKVVFLIRKLMLKANYVHEPPADAKDNSDSVWDFKESQGMSWKHHQTKTFPHFIDGEAVSERGEEICLRSHCVSGLPRFLILCSTINSRGEILPLPTSALT